MLLNWGAGSVPPPEGWLSNLPGLRVEQGELDEVLLNWGDRDVTLPEAAGVPEPSSLLLAAVLVGLMAWRVSRDGRRTFARAVSRDGRRTRRQS